MSIQHVNSADHYAPADFFVGRLENGGSMKLKIGIAIFLLFLFARATLAVEPYNYAGSWRSLNVVAQEAYISGVVDGIAVAYITTIYAVAPDKITKTPPPSELKKTTEKLFVRYTRDQIRDVITDLYKDPANAFISTLDIFFLARDKIEGKDVGKGLMEARKKAIDTHEAIKELKGQGSN
jgi:hypothetical protein